MTATAVRFASRAWALLGSTLLVGALACADPDSAVAPKPHETIIPVASITVGSDTVNLMPDGSAVLTAVVRDSLGLEIAGRTIIWTTSVPSVASVSGSGVVHAHVVGVTIITAACEGKSATVVVQVRAPITIDFVGIVLDSASVHVGHASHATITLLDEGGQPVIAQVTLATIDSAVAWVNARGDVTGLGAGVTSVIVAVGGLADTVGITVTAIPLPATVDAWLTQHPDVAAALSWDPGTGSVAYPDWNDEWKARLQRAVDDASSGIDPHLPDPPLNLAAATLGDAQTMATVLSDDDAGALFFATVARSLMLEISGSLPWSLLDYGRGDLRVLLDSRSFFVYRATPYYPQPAYVVYPAGSVEWSLPSPPATVTRFLASDGILAGTRLETIGRLIQWERGLSHFSGGQTAKNFFDHWQYRGVPPVSRILSGTINTVRQPPAFGHWTAGCHGTNWFMITLLRTVNIPVRYVTAAGHATPYFSSEGRYLSHGDDPYTEPIRLAEPAIPGRELLIDEATWQEWFGPAVTAERRLSNVGRQALELTIQHLTLPLLQARCSDIRLNIVDRSKSSVYSYLNRIHTLAELEEMNLWTRLDDRLGALGGCENIPLR